MGGTGSRQTIYRFDRSFAQPKRIIAQSAGCCGHLDLEVLGKELLIAENLRFRIAAYDFEGKELRKWGAKDRVKAEGFIGCCNPVGLELVGGQVFTAESGIGRVKQFAPDGSFTGLLSDVGVEKWNGAKASKCYIPLEATADGKKFFVMDVVRDVVRVIEGPALN